MENVDIIGFEAVSNIIANSKLTKFYIVRAFQHGNALPVCEYTIGISNKECREAFEEWAKNVTTAENTNVYEMVLYNSDIEDTEDTEDTTKKGKTKKTKLKFVFAFAEPKKEIPAINGIDIEQVKETTLKEVEKNLGQFPTKQDMESYFVGAIEKTILKQQNQELIERLEELEEEIEILKEGKTNTEQKTMIGEIKDLYTLLQGQPQAPINEVHQISGAEAPGNVKENIKTAISILLKYDKELDKDLLLLSKLAENNPAQFNIFLTGLRNLKI